MANRPLPCGLNAYVDCIARLYDVGYAFSTEISFKTNLAWLALLLAIDSKLVDLKRARRVRPFDDEVVGVMDELDGLQAPLRRIFLNNYHGAGRVADWPREGVHLLL